MTSLSLSFLIRKVGMIISLLESCRNEMMCFRYADSQLRVAPALLMGRDASVNSFQQLRGQEKDCSLQVDSYHIADKLS